MSVVWYAIALLLIGAPGAGQPAGFAGATAWAEPVVVVAPTVWSSPSTKELALTLSDSLIHRLNHRRDGQALSLLDATGLAGLGPPPSTDCLVARQVATKLRVPKVLCPAVLLDTQLQPIVQARFVDVTTSAEQAVGPVPAADPESAVQGLLNAIIPLLSARPDAP